MTKPVLVLECPTVEALRVEFDKNLRRARAFLMGIDGVTLNTMVQLSITHPVSQTTLLVDAEVVYVRQEEPGRGVGLQLTPFDPTLVESIRAFVESENTGHADDIATDDSSQPLDVTSEPEDSPENDPVAKNLQERIRALTLVEQVRVAKNGTLPERIALERIFGPGVWEALLANNRLTQPEVARIARKGTVPKPLLDIIAANGTWMASSEVQRALLSNPRSGNTIIMKILKGMTRRELQAVPSQTAYPVSVRQLAKKILKDSIA